MKTSPLRKAALALAVLAFVAGLVWAVAEIVSPRVVSQMARIRAAAVGGALLLLAVTFESIRRTHLKEGYALLWVLPSLLILLLASFPSALDAVRRYFGMEYGSTMAAVIFASLLFAVFVVCRTLSKNERNISKIAQRVALLEARLREIEEGKKDA